MATNGRSCFVISCRISHFGMKPVNGGRPPKDNKTSGVRAVSAGAFVQEVARVLMFVDSFNLKIRKIEKVMVMYVRRARRVSEGENWITKIIQPR